MRATTGLALRAIVATILIVIPLSAHFAAAAEAFRFQVEIHHRVYTIELQAGLSREAAETEIRDQLPDGFPPGPLLTEQEILMYIEIGIRKAARARYFSPDEVNDEILATPPQHSAPQLRFPIWPSAPRDTGLAHPVTIPQEGDHIFAVWPSIEGELIAMDLGAYPNLIYRPDGSAMYKEARPPLIVSGFDLELRPDFPTDETAAEYAAILNYWLYKGYSDEPVLVQGEIRSERLVIYRTIQDFVKSPLVTISRNAQGGWQVRDLWQGLYGTHYSEIEARPVAQLDLTILQIPAEERARVESALSTGLNVLVGVWDQNKDVYYVTGVHAVPDTDNRVLKEGKLSWRDLL